MVVNIFFLKSKYFENDKVKESSVRSNGLPEDLVYIVDLFKILTDYRKNSLSRYSDKILFRFCERITNTQHALVDNRFQQMCHHGHQLINMMKTFGPQSKKLIFLE